MSGKEPNSDLQNSYGLEAAPVEATTLTAPEVSRQTSPLYSVSSPSHTPGTLATDGTAATDAAIVTEKPASEKKKILGLSVGVFWTLVVLGFIAILGLGVGIGVGVGLRHGGSSSGSDSPPQTEQPTQSGQPTQSEQPSSSATSTTSSVEPFVTSGTSGLAANSCTFQTPRTFTASDGTRFTQFCFTDWPRGVEASDGNGTVQDVGRTIVYTFEDCMEECIKHNKDMGSNGVACMGVTYNSNLTSIVEVGKQGGNCFLKNKKGVNLPGSAESASAAVAL